MKKLVIVCEGRTEVKLLENLLYERLEKSFYPIIAVTLPTGENQDGGAAKGGFRSSGGYSFALRHLVYTLKLHKGSVFTMFFDLYGFPKDIACSLNAEKIPDPIEKVLLYEQQIKSDVYLECGTNTIFIPYIQPCESEAFLFVDPRLSALVMANSDTNSDRYASRMTEIRSSYISPEHINAEKGPSKHLEDIFKNYRKNKVGRGGFSWRAAKEIGLDAICKECEHFSEWLTRLENHA